MDLEAQDFDAYKRSPNSKIQDDFDVHGDARTRHSRPEKWEVVVVRHDGPVVGDWWMRIVRGRGAKNGPLQGKRVAAIGHSTSHDPPVSVGPRHHHSHCESATPGAAGAAGKLVAAPSAVQFSASRCLTSEAHRASITFAPRVSPVAPRYEALLECILVLASKLVAFSLLLVVTRS